VFNIIFTILVSIRPFPGSSNHAPAIKGNGSDPPINHKFNSFGSDIKFMKYQILTILCLFSFSCQEPVPISHAALPGMTRKEVEKRLGDPEIKGGFIHSQKGKNKKTPQKERLLLFYMYRDSSLVVFKKDTVFEHFSHIEAFRKRYGTRPRS
jgi:hypothetical protein